MKALTQKLKPHIPLAIGAMLLYVLVQAVKLWISAIGCGLAGGIPGAGAALQAQAPLQEPPPSRKPEPVRPAAAGAAARSLPQMS